MRASRRPGLPGPHHEARARAGRERQEHADAAIRRSREPHRLSLARLRIQHQDRISSGQQPGAAAQGRAGDPERRDLCQRLNPDRRNDLYGWIDSAAPELLRASRELVENGEASRVSDEAVAQILTAAIRLYVAKSDGEERTFPPIAGTRDSEMTPTELLSAVSEMLRALHLGPMELALWYRRRPDEDTYSVKEIS